ncbi:PIN domain-containing protein [Streptomyces sp. A3M-1-3]|uniref:type II toxin-antitoxin system VapC family toxin n=1 Tax=Streptomyces sp. A3M-1-3 TaxID=2962044 RepID=UPI0020B78BA3|nr:PIN domain-containing protein [Streptomyces sp. A3M-1-3]MCP3819070.1 PIN domain-containing protein [Streptomyces sp. A3M-1-3]
MARPRGQLSNGVLLLDSEGLSKAVSADRAVTAFIRAAQSNDTLVAVSDLTLIEAWHAKVRMDRFRWYVSRLEVLPVTEAITWRAIELLSDAGLHGHKYAIDAVVAATALGYAGPRIILTSDVDDMNKLCGTKAQVERV